MSEITFAIAKIGGGKSRFAAEAVCKELERSERMIVTNLATWTYSAPDSGHMSLADWCWKYVARGVDIAKRVRILGRGQTREFYMHYPGFDLSLCNDEGEFAGYDVKAAAGQLLPNLAERQRLQEMGKIPFGCFFVLDEVHLHFGARDWQRCGQGVVHYMSQLRKLNDDVLMITQHPGKVDKNFRRDATEWIYFENMGRRRLWGGVSFAGMVRYQVFLKEPERGDQPERTGSYRISDKEYHRVYDTMAGVGLAGHLLPETAHKKGGHWVRWVIIGVVIVMAACVLPGMVIKWAGKATRGAMRSFSGEVAAKVVGRGASGVVPTNLVPVRGHSVEVEEMKVAPQRKTVVQSSFVVPPVFDSGPVYSSNVWWCGMVVEGEQKRVFLTDETVWRTGDGHLTAIESGKWVEVDGVRYKWKRPEAVATPGRDFPVYNSGARPIR